jgi:hypothetical protein
MPPLHTLNFEAPEDAAPLGGGGEPEGGGEEAWSGPDQETWEQVTETMGMLREAMSASQQQQPQPEQNGQQAPPEIPDPYADPQAFQAWVDARNQEQLAPVNSYIQRLQEDEGRELGYDMLADMESHEGEFLMPEQSRARAYELSDRYYPEMIQRFGDTPKAAEAALARGYKEAKEYELAVGKAFHEREINQLATLSGAPRELSAAGVQGAAQTEIPAGGDERAVLDRWFKQ